MKNNRELMNAFEESFENFLKEKKLDEKITHEEFIKTLPEQISLINSSFNQVFSLLDALNVAKHDESLKDNLKLKMRKLFRKVQRLMELHKEEEESEDMAGNDEKTIEELSSAGGGGLQGSPSSKSPRKSYGTKKMSLKKYKGY